MCPSGRGGVPAASGVVVLAELLAAGGAVMPRRLATDSLAFALLIPVMPADYVPESRIPVTNDAGRRMWWLREHGYTGPINQDGRAVPEHEALRALRLRAGGAR